ncbi:MAG TPA: hypothetical protein VIM61_09780 [Chthoniobacterales bacterium]
MSPHNVTPASGANSSLYSGAFVAMLRRMSALWKCLALLATAAVLGGCCCMQ